MAGFSDWDARASTAAHLGDYKTKGRWQLFPHTELIHDFFTDIIVGKVKRGILTVPPQYGKSDLISGHGLQWAMGRFPEWRCALVSHGAKLAKKWGRVARDFFREHGQELFGVQLDPSRRAADNWGFLGGGGLITTGVNGPLVGEPVDLGIIDDFFKNAKQAQSPAEREALKDWYSSVFFTRLSKDARVFIICTRWHDDDLVGWLLSMMEEGGEKWKVLNLPALAVHPDEIPESEHKLWFPDPLGRQPGEALCPELHPLTQVLEAKRINEDQFWALHQGRPTPPSGQMFQHQMLQPWILDELPIRLGDGDVWEYPNHSRQFDEVVLSLDARWSKKTTLTGSFVVGQIWARNGARKYLLDQIRGRWGLEDTILQIEELLRRWPMVSAKIFEDKALGPEIKKRLDHKISGIILWPCDGGDKIQRAHAQMHHFRGLNVWVPEIRWRTWVSGFRQELLRFPMGTANDQVDAATQVMSYFGRSEGSGEILTAERPTAAQLRELDAYRLRP